MNGSGCPRQSTVSPKLTKWQWLYEQQAQTDDALREYREAVRLRPDMGQAQLIWSAVLAKKGDKAAIEHLTGHRFAGSEPPPKLPSSCFRR